MYVVTNASQGVEKIPKTGFKYYLVRTQQLSIQGVKLIPFMNLTAGGIVRRRANNKKKNIVVRTRNVCIHMKQTTRIKLEIKQGHLSVGALGPKLSRTPQTVLKMICHVISIWYPNSKNCCFR